MNALFTGPPTFTEIDSRRVSNQFGQTERLVAVYRGMEIYYLAWVPQLGSRHPQYPLLFLTGIDRADAGGGLLDVTATFAGTEFQTKTPSGLYYSNLITSTQLVDKSWSWEGLASVGGVLKTVTFTAQYTTIEATFAYTCFNYPNGGQWNGNARTLVAMVNYNWTLLSTPYFGVSTGQPAIPGSINPLLMLTRFTAKQIGPGTYSGSASRGSVSSSQGPWEIMETWALQYNLGSLGVPTPGYSF